MSTSFRVFVGMLNTFCNTSQFQSHIPLGWRYSLKNIFLTKSRPLSLTKGTKDVYYVFLIHCHTRFNEYGNMWYINLTYSFFTLTLLLYMNIQLCYKHNLFMNFERPFLWGCMIFQKIDSFHLFISLYRRIDDSVGNSFVRHNPSWLHKELLMQP